MACGGPYSTLDPAGPSALGAAGLWWGMFGWFMLVLLAVTALWGYAMFRRQDPLERTQAKRIQNRWVLGGGIMLPVISIAVILLFGIPAGYRMLPLPPQGEPALAIEVTGMRWQWLVSYPGTGIETVNELHIPAGRPVDIHLQTADVIHSFWVPRLAGKLDAIPGRINILRIEAAEPGTYHGQCAEYCGIRHAHMQFTVTAHTPEEFEQWLEAGR